jgi:multiple sugar transport system permease protein
VSATGASEARRWRVGARTPRTLSTDERRHAFAFLAPALLFLLALFLLPIVVTLLLSFEPAELNPTPAEVFAPQNLEQISLDNYIRSFSDPVWVKSLGVTAIFGGGFVVLGVAVSLAFALLLNRILRGRAVLLALLLVPFAIPPIVSGTTWGLVVHAQVGTLNGALQQLGLIDRYVVWLGDGSLALATLISAVTWRWIPLMTLLLLAGLQGIARELYESAEVDGASAWQKFRFVTLPELRVVLVTVTILALIFSAKVFDEIWMLTKGGPSYETTVMNLWVYQQAFEFLRFGYGSALAYTLALATLVLVGLYYLASRRGGHEL